MANRVLILTDSNFHRERDSIFPIVAHLAGNPTIDSVSVADRADNENARFFRDCDLKFRQIFVRPAGADYIFATARVPALQAKPLTDFDAVWIRLEFPVSNEFLEYVAHHMGHAFTVNNAHGLIRTLSKDYLMELAPVLGDMMPKASLCDQASEVQSLVERCDQGAVLKQVRSNGGHGVARYRPGRDTDLNTFDDVEAYLRDNGPCLVMEYLNPPGPQSDNRVLVMNGVILGVVSRIPKEGSWICNLSSGGSAENIAPTVQELEIIAKLDPHMRRNGIFLYGADMLLNNKGLRVLSEVNTLNVGAIAVSERLTGKPITKFVADNLAAVIAARDFHISVVERKSIVA